MKTSTLTFLLVPLVTASFLCSYFLELTMSNAEQYLGLIAVVFIDGLFGIIAGAKREGFQTRKAVRVLQRAVSWAMFLTVILMVEKGFSGTTWLSENAEVTLLYGSLIECYTYMKGENDLMQQYDKKFLEALTALKMFGEAKEVTDAYRTGLVTRQKT